MFQNAAKDYWKIWNFPHYIIGDAAFPLKSWLMKPFSATANNGTKRIFNYRHSRARRSVESAFGIFSSRFRLFYKPIIGSVNHVKKLFWLLVVFTIF